MNQEISITNEYVNKAIATFNITDKAIEELSEKYMPLKIVDVKDSAIYALVKEARSDIRDKRLGVEKRVKEYKDQLNSAKNQLIKKETEIVSKLSKIEEHLKGEIGVYDAEKERIKKEKEEVEQLIIANRINQLTSRKMKFDGEAYFYEYLNNNTLDLDRLRISVVSIKYIPEKEFGVFVDTLETAVKFEEERISEITRLEKEEADRIAAEQKAEADMLEVIKKEEAAIADKKRKEQEAILAAERQKQSEEAARLAKISEEQNQKEVMLTQEKAKLRENMQSEQKAIQAKLAEIERKEAAIEADKKLNEDARHAETRVAKAIIAEQDDEIIGLNKALESAEKNILSVEEKYKILVGRIDSICPVFYSQLMEGLE